MQARIRQAADGNEPKGSEQFFLKKGPKTFASFACTAAGRTRIDPGVVENETNKGLLLLFSKKKALLSHAAKHPSGWHEPSKNQRRKKKMSTRGTPQC